ncbi:hypothetical protein O7635_15550 [Asanoa sp. WMMD1127]|uniref:hypothetical protein n=1 Tax=Asanoa sp. WMMD1127 TaxID=3016107 RepID=UPI0024173E33|nr:hypothetical protein [Asanoa sp. WMMD1127]MDG4823271.1 hypothetical protein [Asanoa sp. WMMD1127]
MSYRTLFDATIPPEPPPQDTVDALIGRARRKLALQRIGATAGGIAVVAAASAGGFAVASKPPPSSGPVAIATPTPTTEAARSPRPPVPSTLRGVDSKESAAQAIARLQAAVPRAIRDAVPGVRIDGMPTVIRRNVPSTPTGTGGTYPARFFYDMPKPLTVEVAGKQGSIGVSTERLIEDSFCEPNGEDRGTQWLPPSPVAAPERSCVETAGPGGVRVVTTTLVGPAPGRVVIDMRVDKPDGSMVSINVDSPAGAVLTVEQVLAIALDRRISFYR